MKNSFIMQQKYKRRFERWDAKKCKAILLAMFDYDATGKTNLPEEYYDAFEPIKEDLDALREAWEHQCKVNAENGAKGGRPKTEKSESVNKNRMGFDKTEKSESVNKNRMGFDKTEKSEPNRTKPKKPDNDNDNDYLKEKYIKRKANGFNPKTIRGIERNNDAYDEYGVNMKC